MRTNADLTIYNRFLDPSTHAEKWQRTVIRAVAWEARKASNVIATGGSLAAYSARVFIPTARGIGKYLKPKDWQALAAKTGKFTLQDDDWIVKGAVTDEMHDLVPAIPGPPIVPAVPAFTPTSLKAKYDDVLQIKSVDVMDMGSPNLQHWNVGAK